MRTVAILGSTGSIGRSTLDVVARHPERFRVAALAVLVEAPAAQALEQALRREGVPTRVLCGAAALAEAAVLPEVDTVMAAIVGSAGLLPTLAAARAGKRVLLANKESLVMSGPLLLDAVRQSGAELLPIDSEHNAIFQCLPATRAGTRAAGIRRVLLTASGGPFLRVPLERLAAVTPDQACAHPRWSMGRKISVDSATLMNKGLELIEAQLLFGLPPGGVEVVVHPESIVHSMVEYTDGSTLAQLGNPDMRTPIAYALGWPERIESGVESLDLVRLGALRFEAPDRGKFRCLALAEAAGAAGGTAPAILNAANEVAVAAFLEGRLNFTAIATVIERVLERSTSTSAAGLEDVLEADRQARQLAAGLVASSAGNGA